jgi:hypothetical protein
VVRVESLITFSNQYSIPKKFSSRSYCSVIVLSSNGYPKTLSKYLISECGFPSSPFGDLNVDSEVRYFHLLTKIHRIQFFLPIAHFFSRSASFWTFDQSELEISVENGIMLYLDFNRVRFLGGLLIRIVKAATEILNGEMVIFQRC